MYVVISNPPICCLIYDLAIIVPDLQFPGPRADVFFGRGGGGGVDTFVAKLCQRRIPHTVCYNGLVIHPEYDLRVN